MGSEMCIRDRVWAQRVNKVFVTFEMLGTSNVKVSLTDGLLSLDADAAGKSYKLENMPLWAEIDSEGSKWFSNDRCELMLPGGWAGRGAAGVAPAMWWGSQKGGGEKAPDDEQASMRAPCLAIRKRDSPVRVLAVRRAVVITLKKKEEEWWDGLTKDKGLKRFIKVQHHRLLPLTGLLQGLHMPITAYPANFRWTSPSGARRTIRSTPARSRWAVDSTIWAAWVEWAGWTSAR